MSIQQEQWITGEEWGREYRRLIREGVPQDAPEFQALIRRGMERDESLFERYGRPYMQSHPGQWIAISLDGDVLIRPTSGEVAWAATKAFGPGNFASRRLAAFPGHRIFF